MAAEVNFTWDYTGFFAEFARRGTPMSSRAKNLLLTDSNRAAVRFWHRQFIKKHFEHSAATRYRYQARKEPYKAIKEGLAQGKTYNINGVTVDDTVIKGGTVSLVRSGATERSAIKPVPIFATPGKAVARVIVPRYVSVRRKSGRPNQARELQTVTTAEKQQLNSVWAKNFYRGVRILGSAAFRIRRKQP